MPLELSPGSRLALEGNAPEVLQKLLTKDRAAPKPEAEKFILCKRCGQIVTAARNRISINGTHEHSHINPMGLQYRIGCFDEAPGCTEIGAATSEFTWFAGYDWRVALCQSCRDHLGWGFHGGGGELFYGLILNRLATTD